MTTESPACDFGGSIEEMDPSIGEFDRGSSQHYETTTRRVRAIHVITDVLPEWCFRHSLQLLLL